MGNHAVANKLLYFASHPARTVNNIRFRIAKTISPRKHIFIVGVPRSGTTLLKTILATHPEIAGSDWESTGIFGFRDIFDYHIGELKPERIRHLLEQSSDIVDFYDNVVDSLLKQAQKQFFVDKLQVQGYRVSYVLKHFPESIFLHIVRDGRDCYCSSLGHPNVRQSSSISKFARYWSKSVSLPEKLIPPDRLYQVRYEDLTSDSEAATRRLVEFIGLGFVERQISVEHFSATNSMKNRKVHENLAKPISARSQRRWEKELDEVENDLFCSIADHALSKYGYLSRPNERASLQEERAG